MCHFFLRNVNLLYHMVIGSEFHGVSTQHAPHMVSPRLSPQCGGQPQNKHNGERGELHFNNDGL